MQGVSAARSTGPFRPPVGRRRRSFALRSVPYSCTGARVKRRPLALAVLFFHGGGYIFGHIDLLHGLVSRYVSASGVPILSVEYRRAPSIRSPRQWKRWTSAEPGTGGTPGRWGVRFAHRPGRAQPFAATLGESWLEL
ncbi:alpha/beta hydrolase fold domain-containing protein [Streptomyces sp. NBC_00513]